MYTDEQFEKFEEQEFELTTEEFAAIILLLSSLSASWERELSAFYRKYGRDGVVTYQEARKWVSEKDHRRRLAVLLLFISDSLDVLFNELEQKFGAHLTAIILNELKFFDSEIDLEKALYRTYGEDDSNWHERLWRYRDKWATTVGGDLKLAMLTRMSIDKVIELVNDRVTSMKKILWKLYLSETTAVGSSARLEIFKKLGISKYRFYTRADERTCEECGVLHGLVFPISAYEIGVTASPIHPHCRCWEVPVWE